MVLEVIPSVGHRQFFMRTIGYPHQGFRVTTISTTNTDLLNGLKANDDRVWSDFCQRYRPVVISFGRSLGLSEQDAQDAAQDTLLKFVTAYRDGQYERDRGRLRNWLMVISRSRVRDIQRRRREVILADKSNTAAFVEKIPDDRTMDEIWEREWQQAILNQCMAELRNKVEKKTVEAFELFVIQDWPAEKVAAHLGMSRSAVYQAKNRLISHLRKLEAYWQENW
jgi:RNA polymerase sigma-70 factor (ECF subfamily)